MSTSTPGISPDVAALTTDVAELKDMMKTLILDKQKSQAPATVKAVVEKCVTCGGAHSGASYDGPQVSPPTFSLHKVVENEPEVKKDTVPPTNNGSTKYVQPPVVQVQPYVPNSEPVVAPVSAPMPNSKPSIPYPSRRNDERRREKSRGPMWREILTKSLKNLSSKFA
ncbi:hypothetical protein Tco_0907985 [Tanacetum coccineum]|uniref:Reverse transcriptase domain-containing protein n=1 Tax=Tanacetum coccineum TaxID=301880 RepID=A0ABQ5CL18_9ASTR